MRASAAYTFAVADPLEWSATAALLRRPDEHFRLPDELASLGLGEPCVWALHEGVRVGGAIAGEGLLAAPFVIPPCGDRRGLIDGLTRYVASLTPADQPILAPGVRLSELEDFLSAGWRPAEEPGDGLIWCSAMARVPQRLPTACPEGYRLARPRKSDAYRAARLLAKAYEGVDPLRPDAAYFRDDYLEALEAMNPLCRKASSIAWRGEELAGVCLISHYAGRPVVWDIAVARVERSRGLARAMLRHALSELTAQGDLLRLFVRADNPAAALYRDLGFIAGETTCDMALFAPEGFALSVCTAE